MGSRRSNIWLIAFADGLRQDRPIGRFPLLAVPRHAAVRPIPGRRSTFDHWRLADAIRQLGTRHERYLLHGFSQVEGGHPANRVWTCQESAI